jgi:ferredoxin
MTAINNNIENDFPEKFINKLKVVIDRTTCIGSANCVKSAPEVFVLDEEKICTFRNDLQTIDEDRLIESCTVCPVSALSIFDRDNNQLVP